MRKFLLATAAVLISYSAASAQDDCIQNVNGETVCGADADAVRARMRAEEAIANGKDPQKVARKSSGSVYSGFGPSAFVRGGYIFNAHGGGVSGSASTPTGAVGYRAPLSRFGRNQWSVETEIVYSRDSDDTFDPITVSAWQLTGLASLRWEYASSLGLNPFVSAGIGPSYGRVSISDGIDKISDGAFAFGYSGRAGVETELTDGVSVEAGYRYLGATNGNGTLGMHSAELGLNINF